MPGKPVVTLINPDTLLFGDKRKSLESVNLIKEKICDKIKGITCADDSNPKKYPKEVESVSFLVVSLESLLFTLIIDVYKGSDVATFDVSGAYLHSYMTKDKRILMKLRGDFVDIMCQVNPEYKQHVRYENVKS